jgi:hypothetical protein
MQLPKMRSYGPLEYASVGIKIVVVLFLLSDMCPWGAISLTKSVQVESAKGASSLAEPELVESNNSPARIANAPVLRLTPSAQ